MILITELLLLCIRHSIVEQHFVLVLMFSQGKLLTLGISVWEMCTCLGVHVPKEHISL